MIWKTSIAALLGIFCIATAILAAPAKEALETATTNKSEIPSIVILNNGGHTTITFPTNRDIEAAAYMRGKKLWVIFDQPVTLQIPIITINSNENSWLHSIEQKHIGAEYTCFVLQLNTIKAQPMSMTHTSEQWSIDISDTTPKQDLRPIKVISRADATPIPRVELDIGYFFHPLRFRDPDTGENMVVVPLLEDHVGVPEQYQFVDFNILQSIQGAAIQVYSDDLTLQMQGRKIHISSNNGLNIASKVYTTHNASINLDSPQITYDKQIFQLEPFVVSDSDFTKKLKSWQRQLYAPNPKEAHLSLALFYAAHRFYKEARSIIQGLEIKNPEYSKYFDVALIKAIIAFLDHDNQAAYESISQINISDVPVNLRREVRLWHGIIEYAAGIDDQISIGTDITQLIVHHRDNFLAAYTDHAFIELALTIMANRIQNKDFEGAKVIYSMLIATKDNMTTQQNNQLLYEIGNYYQAHQEFDSATDAWDQCAEDLNDTMHRAHCRFAKAHSMYKRGKLTYEECTDTLEKIAISWRGDDLEIQIMKELGDIYYDHHAYLQALRSWQTIADNYPNTSDALLLAQRMSDTFISFFLQDDGNATPFQAVSMFYEFQGLIPLGDVGDELIIKLTQYLMDLDLLNQSIPLLNHLVDNRLQGVRREEIINRLAQAYILDGLPFNALETIAKGQDYDLIPTPIAQERKYIHAHALISMNEVESIEALLKGDMTPKADDIRAQIYWERGEWQKFSQNSEPYIYANSQNSEDLTPTEVIRVMRQSVAYMMLGQDELLQSLYKHFYHRIPNDNRYAEVMAVLANLWQARAPMDGTQNVDELRQLIKNLSVKLES